MAKYIEAAICCPVLPTHYLTNRNFDHEAHGKYISYCSRIRKNVTENRQTDTQRAEKPITEVTLIPMDRWVEQTNKSKNSNNYTKWNSFE